MMIEFNVTNIRSFREKQTLNLACSKYFKELEESCFDTEIAGLPKLLRSIAIYGPNASGKSNLLSSLNLMRYLVLSSAKKIQEGEELKIVPFMLDQSSKAKGSEVEVIFIEGGVRFQYGFALNNQRVLREWLIAYPEGRPQRWFDRIFEENSAEDVYEFGPKFLGGRLRQEWRRATRSNALFLSVAVQFNSEQLKPVFNWFQKRLHIIPPHGYLDPEFTAKTCETVEGKTKVVDFLSAADLSIADIRIDKKKFSPEELPKDMPPELRELLRKTMEGRDLTDVKLMHRNIETGELVEFGLGDESDGTKNLFSFAGPWLDVIGADSVLFVDEIDSSLHPVVVHQLVRLLHKSRGKAQIVFTTHDTTILSQDIMRRDQVWFIEKDKSNTSRLYPLSDFKVREHEALEKGYLRGRYGAIPFIKEFSGT
jgi:AAA15 family ATPase/GTPase